MYKPEHKTTDLENAAFFSVPGFPYSRQSFQGFILFSTCLTLYGELKYLCAIKFFRPEISQPRRYASAVQRTCCTRTYCRDADRGEQELEDHDVRLLKEK